jgi:hypothetical protein
MSYASNASTALVSTERSPTTTTVDNILRRRLRVSDPRNPEEVAKALLGLYDDEARQISRERQGIPFTVQKSLQAPDGMRPGALPPTMRQGLDDLDDALKLLTTSAQLREIQPELRGWSQGIRAAASDGLSSARFALDPRERDRAFAARRRLGDYARLARYCGALSDCARDVYCMVANACDEVANLMLVGLGDALADSGVTQTGSLLQAPAADLQTRRDAVIGSLRNLLGTAMAVNGNDTWPRATEAVRQLGQHLGDAGESDLRIFLDEQQVARMLDDLIDLASGISPDALRALGATAAMTVQNIRRFAFIAAPVANPESPPLASYISALRLFADGFSNSRSGCRLPYLSQPPILAFGRNSLGAPDLAVPLLMQLALLRGQFASALDCLCCTCGGEDAESAIILAKALYDVDRSIDLYALGHDPNGWGRPEITAAGYGYVVEAVRAAIAAVRPEFHLILGRIREIQFQADPFNLANQVPITRANAQRMFNVLCHQQRDEGRWRALVLSLSSICRRDLMAAGNQSIIGRTLTAAMEGINAQVATGGIGAALTCPVIVSTIPAHRETTGASGTFNRPMNGMGGDGGGIPFIDHDDEDDLHDDDF